MSPPSGPSPPMRSADSPVAILSGPGTRRAFRAVAQLVAEFRRRKRAWRGTGRGTSGQAQFAVMRSVRWSVSVVGEGSLNVFHIEADCRSWPGGCQLDFESAGLRRFVGEASLGECTQQGERFKLELNDTCLAITQGCGDGLLEVEYLRQMRNS